MVLIVTTDLTLAKQLVEAVPGEKAVFLTPARPDSDLREDADDESAPRDAEACHRWLRHNIHEHQPSVILLDVRFGGNRYRVIESVPKIIEGQSRPRVVLLIPFASDALDDHAFDLGCFDVVNLQSSDFLSHVVEAVIAARADRVSRRQSKTARVPSQRGKMH